MSSSTDPSKNFRNTSPDVEQLVNFSSIGLERVRRMHRVNHSLVQPSTYLLVHSPSLSNQLASFWFGLVSIYLRSLTGGFMRLSVGWLWWRIFRFFWINFWCCIIWFRIWLFLSSTFIISGNFIQHEKHFIRIICSGCSGATEDFPWRVCHCSIASSCIDSIYSIYNIIRTGLKIQSLTFNISFTINVFILFYQ